MWCSMQIVRRLLVIAVTAAVLIAAVAQADVRELGGATSAPFPAPGCPKDCSVIARVTGYQGQAGSVKNPFVVPSAGRIVAFTVALGNPSASQLAYFSKNFGSRPELR